jgi:hypothetical protein
MNNKEIKDKIRQLERERNELLYYKHESKDIEMVVQTISDIEFKIVALEDQLDFQKRMLPLKIMLYGFIVTAIGLLIWAFLEKK